MERQLDLTIMSGMVSFLKPFPHRLRTNTMPTPIVAATCPVPACNLAPRDVESLVADLAAYADHFLSAFPRKDHGPIATSKAW